MKKTPPDSCRLVLVSGLKGAGKTTTIKYFQRQGFLGFEQHDEYHRLLRTGELPPEEIVPPGVWDDSHTKLVYHYVLSKYKGLRFYDGLLRTCELEFLRSREPVDVLAVKINKDKLRYERTRKRSRDKEGQYSDEDFRLRDLHRLGMSSGYTRNNLADIMSQAKWTIINDGTVEELESKLAKILPEILK